MERVQSPVVAGLFYPGDAARIREDIGGYLAAAEAQTGFTPKALIAPHAGYVYSGPVAGSAYATLAPLRGKIERVIILAPAHRVAFRGIAYSSASLFRTPLGELAVDRDALELVSGLPVMQLRDDAFAAEHSIEVHLPFLQLTLGDCRILPLLVGQTGVEQVDQLLEILWGGEETLILISSDLSHYLDYDAANALDRETSRAIESLDPARIGFDQACGRLPIGGLLLCARRHQLRVATLDLRNSGDTAGPRDRVVGYGAYAFY
ncbi:MAG: AmmeMemoRadiSam system protein B [Gammaproteobacteria bacterium]|nr:AmmeMemoRadiSam system protein B [Gammaproteobacteria bacterium]